MFKKLTGLVGQIEEPKYSNSSSQSDNEFPSALDETTKENLCLAYKKLYNRYDKHKLKFNELENKFKLTVTTHDKHKKTMIEAHDKLIKRIVELEERDQNVQEEIAEQFKKIEEEMTLAFEFKNNELNGLRKQLIDKEALERRCELQQQTYHSMEKDNKIKEKKIEDLKLVISRLERSLNDDKTKITATAENIESNYYNVLKEENVYLKKERLKMLQMFLDTMKKFKTDFDDFKMFAKCQLSEWLFIYIKRMQDIKAEYSTRIESYHQNFVKTKQSLEIIRKSHFILKSFCFQTFDNFKIEIIEKYSEDVMNKISRNNEKLENRKMDLQKLREEIDDHKNNELRSVNAEVKELQECIEVSKQSLTNLQNEYSNYQATEQKNWTNKIIEIENKWLKKMNDYKNFIDTQHRQEVEDLINEWTNKQKKNENEMEYLKNVLYEYMMGKQPLILAKVLAAIIKFDENQLNTILKKEEEKMVF